MSPEERKQSFYDYVINQLTKPSEETRKRYICCLEKAYKQYLANHPRLFKQYPSIYDLDNIQKLNAISNEHEFHNRNTQGGTPELAGLNLYIEYLYSIEDSYQNFLKTFDIDENVLFKWGIDNAIFPKRQEVEAGWCDLIDRIATGSSCVRIRGYGRNAKNTELFIEMYKRIFPKATVKEDSNNNYKPKRILENMTKLKRNENLFNYQVSHIFGYTKNIFLFEASWNICYLPKIMDPLSGHEAKGLLPPKFQNMFQKKTKTKYRKYIEEYNLLLNQYDVINKMNIYFADLKSNSRYTHDEEYRNMIDQFEKDAYEEFSVL